MTKSNDWVETTVGDAIDEFGGCITTGPFGTLLKASEYTPNGVPLISVGEIRNGFVALKEHTPRVDHSVTSRMPQYLLREGDIVFGRKGAVERSARITSTQDGWFLGSDGISLRLPSSQCDSRFISYLLQDNTHSQWITRHALGSTMLSLNQLIIRRIPLLLPPLPEQKKIAAILATWDRAIELIEKLIAAKQKLKQAQMQQLLTGKVRFEGFVKSQEKFSTRYGDYPKDWKYVRLGKVAKEVSERNTDGSAHQVLSCTKYDGLVDSLTYFGKQIFSDDLSTYKIVRRNEFAYATNHIEEGSIGYQNVCDIAVISPMYTVFKTMDGVDDGFLYKLLKSDLYVHIYQANTSASVDRRGSLRWGAFSQIRISLPSIDEQRAIADVLNTQDKEINLLRSKCTALKEQKRGLMQQLLTGKVRVDFNSELVEA